MDEPCFETLDRGDGVKLAFERIAGAAPTLVWLGGFGSDMTGTKAEALAQWARETGRAFLRFDYSGHGRSEGRFEDGTIGRWLADALAVVDGQSEGPLGLIGSSMGAWIALLAARARPDRVKGLLLLAPAADFTEKLMWETFPDAVRREIIETGRHEMASAYDPEPTVITRALIDDGRAHSVLDQPIEFTGPVRIIQGLRDPDVPWAHALKVAQNFQGGAVHFDLIRDGDHRLSRLPDLARIRAAAAELAAAIGSG